MPRFHHEVVFVGPLREKAHPFDFCPVRLVLWWAKGLQRIQISPRDDRSWAWCADHPALLARAITSQVPLWTGAVITSTFLVGAAQGLRSAIKDEILALGCLCVGVALDVEFDPL